MMCQFLPSNSVNQPSGYICPLPLKPPSQPSRLSQSTRLSPLCPYSSFLLACYFTYANIYVSVLPSQFIPPLLPLLCPQVCSLPLHLDSCPANRFITIVFLDSMFMGYYMILVFLFLTYFTLYDRLWVHPHHCK